MKGSGNPPMNMDKQVESLQLAEFEGGCAKTEGWYRKIEVVMHCKHCKPSPFAMQFCMANTDILTPYITCQSNHK